MTGEDLKGGIHAAAASLFAVMAAYNALRYVETHRRRNLVNLLMYGPMMLYEWDQVHRHWSARHA